MQLSLRNIDSLVIFFLFLVLGQKSPEIFYVKLNFATTEKRHILSFKSIKLSHILDGTSYMPNINLSEKGSNTTKEEDSNEEINTRRDPKPKWDKTWTNPSCNLKIGFLYHYYGLHFHGAPFDFIDWNDIHYSVSWREPKLRDKYPGIKILSQNLNYLIGFQEMRNDLFYCYNILYISRHENSLVLNAFNSFKALRFFHQNPYLEIDLKKFSDIPLSKTLDYFICYSNEIYNKNIIACEWIDSINKCQLSLIIILNKAKELWADINSESKTQSDHVKYIIHLIKNIILNTVTNTNKKENITLSKLALNILPFNHDKKIAFINQIHSECIKISNNKNIELWLSNNYTLYQWATGYLLKRIKNTTITDAIIISGLDSEGKFTKIKNTKFRALLTLINNMSLMKDITFDFKNFQDASNTKKRRQRLAIERKEKKENEVFISKDDMKKLNELSTQRKESPRETIHQLIADALTDRKSAPKIRASFLMAEKYKKDVHDIIENTINKIIDQRLNDVT